MDLWTVANGLRHHLSVVRGVTFVNSDNPLRAALVEGAKWGLKLAGISDPGFLNKIERTSVCIPLVVGNQSLVLLSSEDARDPVTYAEAVAHQAHHDAQSDDGGHVRVAWEYVISDELRAKREADAYAVGVWTRYLLTGLILSDSDSLVELETGPHHLDVGNLSLCRGVLVSHLATIRSGSCPPISTAKVILDYLKSNHPGSIKATSVL